MLIRACHLLLHRQSPRSTAGDTTPRILVTRSTANNQRHRSRCRIVFEDRPGGDIVYKLDTKADVEALKSNPFILKEKCMYRLQISFRVQHEIVSGLKFTNKVHSLGQTTRKMGFDPHSGLNFKTLDPGRNSEAMCLRPLSRPQ